MKLKSLFTVFSFMACTVASTYAMDLPEELTDPKQMLDVIRKELNPNDCSNCRENRAPGDFHMNAFRKIDESRLFIVASLYARYCIIGQLDAACCYDAGTRECFKRYTEEQPFSQTIKRRVPSPALNRILQEQHAWVEEKVEKDAMQHSLRYIEGYSFDSFGDVPRAIIIPQDQWKEKRKAVLEELKDQFSIQ